MTTATPEIVSEETVEAIGSEACFERFLEKARALPEGEVTTMRGDPNLALHNVQVGLKALEPHWDALDKALPELDADAAKEAEDLALGLVFASGRLDRQLGSGKNVFALLRRGRELRDLLLSTAEVLTKAGLLPGAAVKKIRSGKGPVNEAEDLVQLSALYRDHADALKGKSPISVQAIKEAASLGTELLAVLTPLRAKHKRDVPPELREAGDVRDRLWTLLVKGHREMRRAGMWLWVDDVNEHVPPLLSQAVKSRKKKDT